ncbi:universal stress protein [Acetobacter sp.]|jgi:nucleotide-binding universal stress UspA family protein|uniref:universal stress protein n=1 Tax=Acetobacter sp. TaxID=440 RepID=UPI0025C471B6|nr:universal stress protein [Acetobacter sp.]MCH4092321.1 universal stress protein [Acetobacter sp.]MCI1301002.1 universal stress protein [Acetobacter sp.]MCI1317226.1 universal stress protein [Acetobacter sp.]
MRILVILDRPETALLTLETVGLLIKKIPDCAIKILHPRLAADPKFQSPDEGIPSADDTTHFENEMAARSAALLRVFKEWRAISSPLEKAEWSEISGIPRAIVAEQAAMADLTVLGRPLSDDPDYVRQAFDGALYDAQATVLITPLQRKQTVATRPVIAWHPSASLEQLVIEAHPLLKQAAHVTVLIGEERENEEQTPDIVHELRSGNIPVCVERFIIPPSGAGEEIRKRALAAGGDLLVMGAYTHSHFLEWLFGGATQDILAHDTLPILTHH